MSTVILHYLGPEGTFTHQAAIAASEALDRLMPGGIECSLVPQPDVPAIVDATRSGAGYGVIAW